MELDYKWSYRIYRYLPIISAIVTAIGSFLWAVIDSVGGNSIICESGILAFIIWIIIGAILTACVFFISMIRMSATVVRTDAVLALEEKFIEKKEGHSSSSSFIKKESPSLKPTVGRRWLCTSCGSFNDIDSPACSKCGAQNKSSTPKPSAKPAKRWLCTDCGEFNLIESRECKKCGRINTSIPNAPAAQKPKAPRTTMGKRWICPSCGAFNPNDSTECSNCSARKNV